VGSAGEEVGMDCELTSTHLGAVVGAEAAPACMHGGARRRQPLRAAVAVRVRRS
jgi:hypothetical protein